eukprot:TRINITY_DN4201_c0_g1_i5.p2 TRINITY_DN4201_c0_g1~~TRINITY_DN4201_c0_g1_i5.p2  ORF type:complete len:121 (+),score=14.88 TRINITY_DN4201_c0_g1_i5:46-363(+)
MIGQIVDGILRGEEIRDLNKSQSSLGSFLQSGLGRLGFGGAIGGVVQQSQFQDIKTVIIFVVGGVCMRELRETLQILQDFDDSKQVIVGGTSLVEDVQVLSKLMI